MTAGGAGMPSINWNDEPANDCARCGRVTRDATETTCDCGWALAPMPLPRVIHGKFALERRLGRGGMGVVYRGVDLALGRPVAIKSLPRIVPESAQRLRQEARAMAAVSHPHLAVIYGAETWRSVPILIVELLEGGTLSDRLRQGALDEAAVTDLGRTLASALARLHGAGMLHRDVKPSNVGFTADGVPKLLDFGLARLIDERRPEPGVLRALDSSATGDSTDQTSRTPREICGTPLYLSPEAVSGKAPDASFDLWALAMLLLEALAGRHPWADLPLDILLDRISRKETVIDTWQDLPCSKELTDFLSSALAVHPSRRPQSATVFEQQLQTLAATTRA